MNPLSIRFALYTLAGTTAWIFIEHMAGFNTTNFAIGEITHNFAMIAFWILIFVEVYFQRKENGNSLTFKEGFLSAFQFSIFYCIGFALLIAFYQHIVNPEYYENYKAFVLERLHQQNATQETIDSTMKEVDLVNNGSLVSYSMMFLYSMILAVGLSAIAAGIFKRKSA